MWNDHKVAAEAEIRRLGDAAKALIVPAALSIDQAPRAFAIEASRNAARQGRSFSKAVKLNGDAIRYRRHARACGWPQSKHYSPRVLPA